VGVHSKELKAAGAGAAAAAAAAASVQDAERSATTNRIGITSEAINNNHNDSNHKNNTRRPAALAGGLLTRDGLLRHESDAHFLECLEWTLRVLHNVSECLVPHSNGGSAPPTEAEHAACEQRAWRFSLVMWDVCDVLRFQGLFAGTHASTGADAHTGGGSGSDSGSDSGSGSSSSSGSSGGSGKVAANSGVAAVLAESMSVKERLQRVCLSILRHFCATRTGCQWFIAHMAAAPTPMDDTEASSSWSSSSSSSNDDDSNGGGADCGHAVPSAGNTPRMWQLLEGIESHALEVQTLKSVALSLFAMLTTVQGRWCTRGATTAAARPRVGISCLRRRLAISVSWYPLAAW
jgi:uncharacterized membrane protein YgcG